jgi:hypothetical protein
MPNMKTCPLTAFDKDIVLTNVSKTDTFSDTAGQGKGFGVLNLGVGIAELFQVRLT